MPDSRLLYPDTLFYHLISFAFVIPLFVLALRSDKEDELSEPPKEAVSEDMAVYQMDALKALIGDAEINDDHWHSLLKIMLHHKSLSKDSANPLHQLNMKIISSSETRNNAIKIMNQYLIYLYGETLEKFSSSIRLRISFAFYLCRNLRFHNQSLQLLYQTLMADCRSQELYKLSKAQTMIEETISKRMSSVPNETSKSILASSKVENLFSRMVLLSSKIAVFWRNITNSHSSLTTTANLSAEIMEELTAVRKEMKLPFYQNFPPLLIAYYRFEKEALFNESLRESYLANLTEKAKSMIESLYSLENVTPETDLTQTEIGFAVLESNDQKRFEVINANKSFARVLNYTKDEIVGTDFLVHVPKQMQGEVRGLLNTEREFTDKTVTLIMRYGCIRDFSLSVKRMTDEDDRDIAIAKLSSKTKAASAHMLIADKSGVVTAYSTGSFLSQACIDFLIDPAKNSVYISDIVFFVD